MRLNLFWQLGLAFLVLLFAVLLAVGIYAERYLEHDYRREALEKLEAIARVAQSRPPSWPAPQGSRAELDAWTRAMAASGARVTLISPDGVVLADSSEDPAKMENHAGRPEVQQALASGSGHAVRHSVTLGRDLVYWAVRQPVGGGEILILRFALLLKDVDQPIGTFRRHLLQASVLILVLAGIASLLVSRRFSARVEWLKEFSRRVAAGDFRPLRLERTGDALEDLGRALNETAAQLDRTIRTLTEERNRSAAILRSMVEAVAVISADERVIFCNDAFAHILGVKAADCEGRRTVEVMRQSDLLEVIKKVLATRRRADSEVVTGTVRPRSFAVAAAPIHPDGAAGAVLVLHDISELRRLERVRRDFVANVSHEFKTPLTAIQGFAETLLGGAMDDAENRHRFLEIIRDHARRLAQLTDDLLKLSQIEAERMELEMLPVRLPELISGCLETTRFRERAKDHVLEIDCPPDLPPARGDRSRLAEVLQNLLDNAVQYTPAGGRITVRARATENDIVITVSDTGIGIPQAEQARIFERFYRVDTARSREVGGTGLGLSIARHIVEAHGGRIWVESSVGHGSDFHFSVPRYTAAPEAPPAAPNSPGRTPS